MAMRKVLHIEDDAANRRLVRKVLSAEGFEVVEADSGIDGIRKALASQPDIILLDIELPDMDGYEVTLKPSLAQGSIEVRSQATMRAADVDAVLAADTFVLHTPQLVIEREQEDLNGGTIEPGDTVRFTISFRNSGVVEAREVVVQDDFADGVVAEVSEISSGGVETGGTVVWDLNEPLQPDEERVVSYIVRLVGEIDEPTTTANVASISIDGVQVAQAENRMAIEPAPSPTPETQPVAQVFENQPLMVAVLVGVSAITALVVIGGLVGVILRKNQWKERYFRLAIEGVVVVVIVEAVLVLAMNHSIEADGAVTVLSGLAGYLLGRGMGESSGSSDKKD